MLELSRTVRFCLDPDRPQAGPRHNTFAAWPPMRGLGRYYEMVVTCRGEADPATGYLTNIKHIDQAVRVHVLPYLESLLAGSARAADIPMGGLMQRLLGLVQNPLNGIVSKVRFQLMPSSCLLIRSHAMDHVILKQQYEFSAAHRLNVPVLSEEENRQAFGKCNNPAGHGHNYRIEVAVHVPIASGGQIPPLEDLDAVVSRRVIDRLDHKHLNADVPEFAQLNPSVENIAMVIWEMLTDQFKPSAAGEGAGLSNGFHRAALESVSVWETEKTVCTYRGRTPA